MARAVLIAVLALLAFAPGASAAAPTLVSVTQSGGKVSASWTLPAGGQTWTIEVSKSNAVDSDGYFLADDVVDTQVFVTDPAARSWTSDVVLPAGTYYVHLSGADVQCASCPFPEWSPIRTLTVGASTSSGGSSGGGSTAPAAPSAPTDTGSTPTSDGTPTSATPTTTAPAAAYGTVSKATARLKGNLATVSFGVCGSGSVDVTVAVTRGKASHVAVVTLPLDGCTSYALRLSAPGGTGRVAVSVGTGGATGTSSKL